jgi:predicted ester cyclase
MPLAGPACGNVTREVAAVDPRLTRHCTRDTDWMKGLLMPVPDGHYELRSFAVDDERNNVAGYAVFRGTHSGDGGPVPPTGKKVEADYVYVMEFDGDRIRHMTKIWNDGISLQQLGWA